jgi:hypothetical protein
VRRNELAQFAAGGPVLPGAFDRAGEHVTGDDGEDKGTETTQAAREVLRA